MSVDDIKFTIKAAIRKQLVNNYSNREAVLRSNLDMIYGIFGGQWSHGINYIIRNNKCFEEKSHVINWLWLLEHVEEVTPRLDNNSNKSYNLHWDMLNFLTIRQGQQESDDFFSKRFDDKLHTIDMEGVMHIICSK